MPIEQVSSELGRIVSVNAPVEQLADGFGNDNGPAEGPLWWKEGGYLLFSDIGNNRRMKWTAEDGVSVFQEPSNYANGLTRDVQGRLVACDRTPSVRRHEPDGSTTVVANSYQGRSINRPNDVVVMSDGSIYFTDPGAPAPGMALDFSGVYRVSADLGTLTLLLKDFVVPNGLAFSPDESILYVNDTRRMHIRGFDVLPNGTLALGSDRVFSEVRGSGPGFPDGMKVDSEGNVYCGGSGGIWIIDPAGNHLGTIVHGAPETTNVAFGGDDWKTLYFTTWHTIGRVQLNVPGIPVPVGG